MQLICATSCAWHAKCTCSCSKDAAASTAESKNRRPSLETTRERGREEEGQRGRGGASKRRAGSDKQFKLPSNSHTAHSLPPPPFAHIHIRLKLPPTGNSLPPPPAPNGAPTAAGRAVAVAPISPLQNTRRTRHKFCTLFCGAAQNFSAFASQQHTHTHREGGGEQDRGHLYVYIIFVGYYIIFALERVFCSHFALAAFGAAYFMQLPLGCCSCWLRLSVAAASMSAKQEQQGHATFSTAFRCF